MISVSKSWQFQAAHSNPYHPAECKNLHGHTYTVRVWARGNRKPDGIEKGMVIDLRRMSDTWKRIYAELDHSNLNESTPCDPTTIENLAAYILDYFRDDLNDSYTEIFKVRVYEGATAYAEASL